MTTKSIIVYGLLLSLTIGLLAPALQAGTLEVTRSPLSPKARTIEAGTPSYEVVLAVQIEGLSGVSVVHGLALSTAGSADWATALDSSDGITILLDDGDLQYGGTDHVLWQGAGANGMLSCMFASPLFIPDSGLFILWVAVHRTVLAGTLLGESFAASVSAADDVFVDPADSVLIGVPAPNGSPLTVAEVHFAKVSPLSGSYEELTVVGFGFRHPVSITVGGYLCNGTPIVSADGTRIGGLRVAGFPRYERFEKQEIRITTGPVVDHVVPFLYIQEAEDSNNGCSLSQKPFSIAPLAVSCIIVAMMWAGASIISSTRRTTWYWPN